MIVVPGPSVLFTVGRALQYGRKPALITVAANTGGEVVHTVLVAVGIGAIIAASVAAFVVLKVAGGLYLVYLGIQAIRHRHDGLELEVAGPSAAVSTGRLWREGFAVGVLNPKTIVFIAAVLPQFVDTTRGPAWAQILLLGLLFGLLALVSDGAWALAASGARTWFAKSPQRMARLRATGGGMMAALGVALLATRPSTL